MCGRFYFITPKDELERYLPEIELPEKLPARYNIAPTQQVPVVAEVDGVRRVEYYRWGLIPAWAKDETIGSRLINARAETLSEKPAFRTALQRRRCVVLASGFFEWKIQPGRKVKTPYAFTLRSGAPLLLAGLWEVWQPAMGTPIHSCTIITTSANALVESCHDRMPVLLPRDALPRWLAPAPLPAGALEELLQPCPAGSMRATPVSTRLNNARYDAPDCLEEPLNLSLS